MTSQSPQQHSYPHIAVLIPCYNEAATVAKVVGDFRAQLPSADIYTYDNNSTDGTADIARAAGATVVREKRQGKGFVLQSMLTDIDADFYVLVDGDDTYPAERVHDLLRPLLDGDAEMVVGTRLSQFEKEPFRPLHIFGNYLVVRTIKVIFGASVQDVMSGYRAFTRNLARSIPLLSKGFEVETELTVQALYRSMLVKEISVHYRERPQGSVSKLRTFHDGFRVLLEIFNLFKAYRPLLFFSLTAFFLAAIGFLLGSIPLVEFLQTRRISHFPTAILAAAIEITAMISLTCGIVLDSIKLHFKELSQLILSQRNRRNTSVGKAVGENANIECGQ
jgi:glycosyltransferase involved in cell wall biosynthesis